MILSRNTNTKKTSVKLYEKKHRLTISLLSITFLFLIMTLPDSIYYGFFESKDEFLNQNIGGALNCFTFLHHSTIFLSLYCTNLYFRRAVFNFFQVNSRLSRPRIG